MDEGDPLEIIDKFGIKKRGPYNKGKNSPATALILQDQKNKSSSDLLEEALASKAPKMK